MGAGKGRKEPGVGERDKLKEKKSENYGDSEDSKARRKKRSQGIPKAMLHIPPHTHVHTHTHMQGLPLLLWAPLTHSSLSSQPSYGE